MIGSNNMSNSNQLWNLDYNSLDLYFNNRYGYELIKQYNQLMK